MKNKACTFWKGILSTKPFMDISIDKIVGDGLTNNF
jgi:hypothetical protein